MQAAGNVAKMNIKLKLIWNDLTCWLWLDFPNLPHFLSDFVGIWNDLQCWFLVGIPKSSTHSERFTANCQDLEFFHFCFIDLDGFGRSSSTPFLHSFSENCLDLEWPNTLILVGIPKSSTGGVWISNGIAQCYPLKHSQKLENVLFLKQNRAILWILLGGQKCFFTWVIWGQFFVFHSTYLNMKWQNFQFGI